MKPLRIFLAWTLSLACLAQEAKAQPENAPSAPDGKAQSIVTISAFTAKGELVPLQKALNEGLDAGLTVSAIKEVLVQLYAYAGFPRSLNALNTFMAVLKERKSKGIIDPAGREASPLPASKSKRQLGTELQTKLVGQAVQGEVYRFAPAIDGFLKEHLFADIFGRDNLDWKTRELATVAALAALGGTEAQLRSHLGVALHNGLGAMQLKEAIALIQSQVGQKEGKAAAEVLRSVLKEKQPEAAGMATDMAGTQKGAMLVRLSEIEIHPDSLDAYKAILNEQAAAAVRLEPGVVSIFPMYQKKDPAQVRILEIYASREAYEAHIKTPHFQRYKTTTLPMVKSLRLVDMEALDPAGMAAIFTKWND